MYALHMLQIMTGCKPFVELDGPKSNEVASRVLDGKRPKRPSDPEVAWRGLDDALWSLLGECWDPDPAKRPGMDAVLKRMPLTLPQ